MSQLTEERAAPADSGHRTRPYDGQDVEDLEASGATFERAAIQAATRLSSAAARERRRIMRRRLSLFGGCVVGAGFAIAAVHVCQSADTSRPRGLLGRGARGAGLLRGLRRPGHGRLAEALPMGNWVALADQAIREVHAALPKDATAKEIRRALREAYPFGERRCGPYKTWLRKRRAYLRLRGIRPTRRRSRPTYIELVEQLGQLRLFDPDTLRVWSEPPPAAEGEKA